MVPVLARLGPRLLCGAIAAAVVVCHASRAQAYQGPPPVSEAEVRGFIAEWGQATETCDHAVMAYYLLPTAELTFRAKDRPDVMMSGEQYLRFFREYCEPLAQEYDVKNVRVKVRKYRAEVRARAWGGAWFRGIFPAVEVDYIEETIILGRRGRDLKVERLSQYAVLKAEEGE